MPEAAGQPLHYEKLFDAGFAVIAPADHPLGRAQGRMAAAGQRTLDHAGAHVDALARQTKMRAEKGARRSTLDISLLRDNDLYQIQAEGTTAPIDAARIPNLKQVLLAFRRDYAIPHIFSALVLVYSTEKIKAAPGGLPALLDPGLKGKAGVVDDQYDYLTLAGAWHRAPPPATWGAARISCAT